MALFDETADVAPAPRPRTGPRFGPRRVVGLWAVAIGLVALLAMTFLPSPYVIQQAGPVINTLGEVPGADGQTVPLIEIDGAQTYPTDGALDLVTVQIVGTPERRPSWLELAGAWLDRTRAILPIDAVYPPGQTTESRNEQTATMMTDSQTEATAAALTHLGYDVEREVVVSSIVAGSPADGALQVGDEVLYADGQPATDAASLRAVVQQGAGAPVSIEIERDGQRQTVSVTPEPTESNGQTVWLIGVTLTATFSFPFDVSIQLNNVGGPSAGMMFALGIIDTLTPDDLNGGAQVAGTGTIDSVGTVGGIGGIRQKMWGAERAGAQYFLAPAANCNEVVGFVPEGLRVFSVGTLDDAIEVLDTVADGGDLDALPACTAP